MFKILNLYIAQKFIKILLYFSLALIVLIFISNFLTNIKLASFNEPSNLIVLFKTLYDIPLFFHIALPYIVLLTTLFFMRSISNSNELDIIMSSSVSMIHIIKIIFPILVIVGMLMVFIISPLHIFLKNKFLNNGSRIITTENNFWILDKLNNNTLLIIKTQEAHIKNKDIYMTKLVLFKIVDNKLALRVDGDSGLISNNNFIIYNASVKDNNIFPQHYETYTLYTTLKAKRLQNATLEPYMINFWQLPRFTKNLQLLGLCTSEYKVYFYNLLFYPINLFSMLVLGIGLSLSKEKRISNIKIIIIGVSVGFILKFFTDLVNALGSVGLLPPILTVLCNHILILCIGLYLIINKEGL